MTTSPWPNADFLDRLGIKLPMCQAPMAGVSDLDMARAVDTVGGLGALPAAMKSASRLAQDLASWQSSGAGPLNVNFFCHDHQPADADEQHRWIEALSPYFNAYGVQPPSDPGAGRAPFDDAFCQVIEAMPPQVVSFHFGLPEPGLLERVRAAGCLVLGCATTVAEARWLDERGCDAIVAQGFEAGGHRGMFLGQDIATQVGMLALVPQVVDAVSVPVIAAGGISDGRGVAAAFALGASAVQVGTALLRTQQSNASDLYRQALEQDATDGTAITNVFSGKPARGVVNRLVREVGPMANDAPTFPHAGGAVMTLRRAAEDRGQDDFSSHWSGQSASLAPRHEDAGEVILALADHAQRVIGRFN